MQCELLEAEYESADLQTARKLPGNPSRRDRNQNQHVCNVFVCELRSGRFPGALPPASPAAHLYVRVEKHTRVGWLPPRLMDGPVSVPWLELSAAVSALCVMHQGGHVAMCASMRL